VLLVEAAVIILLFVEALLLALELLDLALDLGSRRGVQVHRTVLGRASVGKCTGLEHEALLVIVVFIRRLLYRRYLDTDVQILLGP